MLKSLGKLIKHEFYATGRIMLPLYGILLLSAISGNISIRILLGNDSGFFALLGLILLLFFVVAVIAVCVTGFLLMLLRFYKNLLQDEGYIMLTLPVSIHQHIWSKLLVSAVWFTLTALAVILAITTTVTNIELIAEIWYTLRRTFHVIAHNFSPAYLLHNTAFILETFLLLFLGVCGECLRCYAALSIGHSFSHHKLAFSIGVFFAIQAIQQFVSWGTLILFGNSHLADALLESLSGLSDMTAIHTTMLTSILTGLAYCAVFYGITIYFMKNRLNLE